jgi:hypothetical protein
MIIERPSLRGFELISSLVVIDPIISSLIQNYFDELTETLLKQSLPPTASKYLFLQIGDSWLMDDLRRF